MATSRIATRRGGTASSNDSKMTVIKGIFITSLFLLVAFLIRLNYQLMTRLHENPASDGEGMDGTDAKATLTQLRKQVEAAKEKVDVMKSAVNELKTSSGSNGSSNSKALSGSIANGALQRITCTADQNTRQKLRIQQRFQEWWSHSACPDQAWMDNIHALFSSATLDANREISRDLLSEEDKRKPFLIMDIGCNKGYTSADFLDAISPGTGMNPKKLVGAIREIAKEDGVKYDREGGVCNDADKPLNSDTSSRRDVQVHCFEPSPATYNMLTRAKEKLIKDTNEKVKWNIHNLGLHQVSGEMKWHSACKTSVGNELCGIVPDGTADSITVPVVTVDEFLVDTYKTSDDKLPLVHMLKVDAEGLDPAVLTGSTKLLTQNRAMMVMFEFNPGLGEGGKLQYFITCNWLQKCLCPDPTHLHSFVFVASPHGMWGSKGKPHKDLLEVTSWLDNLGYDCYLDTRVPKGKELGTVPEAPALYRISGDCLTSEPKVRGWANVVCASRKWGSVAWKLRRLATMVE